MPLTEDKAKYAPDCFGKYTLEEAGSRKCDHCEYLGMCGLTTREQQDAGRKTTEIIFKPTNKKA
jgi:hypothetical protein